MTSPCPFKIEWSLELTMLSYHEFAHAGAGQGASGCKRCKCEARWYYPIPGTLGLGLLVFPGGSRSPA